MSSVEAVDVPFLWLSDPSFSIRSAEVRKARELSWYARTASCCAMPACAKEATLGPRTIA